MGVAELEQGVLELRARAGVLGVVGGEDGEEAREAVTAGDEVEVARVEELERVCLLDGLLEGSVLRVSARSIRVRVGVVTGMLR